MEKTTQLNISVEIEEQLEKKLTELNHTFNCLDKNMMNSSVFGQSIGYFLFRLYYNRFLDLNEEKLHEELIEFVSYIISKPLSETTYCTGITGFGWFLNHLYANDFIAIDESFMLEIDEVAYTSGRAAFTENQHDFLHGGLGSIFYLAERFKYNTKVEKYLLPLLDQLETLGTWTNQGIYWREDQRYNDDTEKEKEIINLNASHGSASKIAILALLLKHGWQTEQVKKMLHGAISYVLHQRISDSGLIPSRIINDTSLDLGHVGWCRGNLGMSLSIWQGAEALNNPNLKEIALAIAQRAAEEQGNLIDAGICHGFSGMAQMNYRWYLNTNEVQFLDKSNQWLQHTLAVGTHSNGSGGFLFWDGLNGVWTKGGGMMSGAEGIGLVLLSRLMPNIKWDSMFLMS